MIAMLAAVVVVMGLGPLLGRGLSGTRARNVAALAVPGVFAVGLLAAAPWLTPAARLVGATLGLLYALKASVLLRMAREEVCAYSLTGLALFATIWPGMDPAAFRQRGTMDASAARLFVQGWIQAAVALIVLMFTARFLPAIPASVTPWLVLASLLLLVHFGYASLLSAVLRLAGWQVTPLFHAPFKADSFRDFWSVRWNRPFVEMDRLLFLPFLTRHLGRTGALVAVFLLSGVLHELAISFPAGVGWGLPLLYFAIHGVCFIGERHFPRGVRAGLLWVATLGLLPVLFPAPFRETFLLPVAEFLHPFTAHPVPWFLSKGLLLAGLGHFLVLGASFQVPTRLDWKNELARLRSLNRKLMWTYGIYIVVIIVSLGVLTLCLRAEMLAGDRAALFLAGFIAAFWTARLLIDGFFFEHKDWPEGPQFVIGHCLLTTLFVFLLGNYVALLAYHWVA